MTRARPPIHPPITSMYENPQPAGGMPGNPDASDKPDWAAAVGPKLR